MSTANPTIGEFLEIPDTGSLTMATDEAPLLMDVTSHSFGVETAGGYCQHLIRRNAPIPAEQARVFTTAHDGQRRVTARVCQGESRQFEENQILGEIELENLRESARGDLRIGVRFQLNASGTLDVTARDLETGHEQSIRINLRGGLSEDDIAAMQARQQASAD
jgi:molecular chaperone DnaK